VREFGDCGTEAASLFFIVVGLVTAQSPPLYFVTVILFIWLLSEFILFCGFVVFVLFRF